MQVVLTNRGLAVIVILTIVVAIVAGIFHNQSIKGIYQSFSSQSAQDANLNSQNQNLWNQTRQLRNQLYDVQDQLTALQLSFQKLPKVALVQGSINITAGIPTLIFFDYGTQSGNYPSLSSAIVPLGHGYVYEAYLGSGISYSVRIRYDAGVSGTHTCAGVPAMVTPTGTDFTANFSC